MTSNSDKIPSYEPVRQLELVNLKCVSLGPDIYKSFAFYLKLTRSLLPKAIKDAIYQLIISNRNTLVPLTLDSEKESFYERIDKTLSDYLSLLTVENLNAFAEKLDKEKQKESFDLVDSLNKPIDDMESESDLDSSSRYKSVDLSYTLPTDSNIDLRFWDSQSKELNSFNFNYENASDQTNDNHGMINQGILDESEKLDDDFIDAKTEKKDLDLLKSIFMLAGNITSPGKKILNRINESNSPNDEVSPDKDILETDSLLPQSPQDLSRWLFTLDEALVRRLRNLSHLINMELIRVGIINSFLPTNLLDAVISGQVASINAPSNILRLRLPVSSASSNEIDIECLLVRPSELEFDHIKLRQCRQKITQQRNILLKLVRQQRYWQSRSLAKEVREQWWKNSQVNQTKAP